MHMSQSCSSDSFSLMHTQQSKRGVKRQADTTTPLQGDHIMEMGIPKRRESTRKVKKAKHELPGENSLTAPVSVSCV